MSTNNNQDKKSTDTKPKGEVKNINTTTKGLFDYHKEKKDIKIRACEKTKVFSCVLCL